MDDQLKHDPHFTVDDDGAVTVDWVVLTAAIIGLGFLIVAPIAGGTNSLASNVADSIGNADVTLALPGD